MQKRQVLIDIICCEAETCVGRAVTAGLTEAQLEEFGVLADGGDDVAANRWLSDNIPDHLNITQIALMELAESVADLAYERRRRGVDVLGATIRSDDVSRGGPTRRRDVPDAVRLPRLHMTAATIPASTLCAGREVKAGGSVEVSVPTSFLLGMYEPRRREAPVEEAGGTSGDVPVGVRMRGRQPCGLNKK